MPTKENGIPTNIEYVVSNQKGKKSFIPSKVFNEKNRE
jgi:hypothetical protein